MRDYWILSWELCRVTFKTLESDIKGLKIMKKSTHQPSPVSILFM